MESNAGAPSVAGSVTGATVDDSLIWPSMQDLNTRLRRVITAYQRNYKKEELKQQQKAKVNLSFLFSSRLSIEKLFRLLCKSTLLSKVFLKYFSTTIIIWLKAGVIREETKLNKKKNKQILKSLGTETVHKTHTITHEIFR